MTGPETYLRGSSPAPSESDAGVVAVVVVDAAAGAAAAAAAGGEGDAAASEPAAPWEPLCSVPALYPTAAGWVWTSHLLLVCQGPSGPLLQDWA